MMPANAANMTPANLLAAMPAGMQKLAPVGANVSPALPSVPNARAVRRW